METRTTLPVGEAVMRDHSCKRLALMDEIARLREVHVRWITATVPSMAVSPAEILLQVAKALSVMRSELSCIVRPGWRSNRVEAGSRNVHIELP